MEPIYTHNFTIDDSSVDRYGRIRMATILFLAQEMGGRHSELMALDYASLASRRLFWAVTRHRVEISRMPMRGETLRLETWPLPATRTAFPRSVIAYDSQGIECFRVMTLWVLMDIDTRRLVVPGKSGIVVAGTLRGNELAVPGGLILRTGGIQRRRTVAFSDLDRNGHMNNTRCMEWIDDLFPSEFHAEHPVRECTVCYLAEAKEQQELIMNLELRDNTLQVDAVLEAGDDSHRVFSAQLLF